MAYYIPRVEDKEEMTIGQKVDRLIESIESTDEKKSKKKFKVPFGMRMGAAGKIKKGYVLVFLLRTNGGIDLRFLPIKNDMIYLKDNDTYHMASTEYVFRYKKYPAMVLPEWSLEPLSPRKHYEETVKKGELSIPQRVIIKAIEMSQLKGKTQIGGGIKWIIIIGLIVAGIYLLTELIK